MSSAIHLLRSEHELILRALEAAEEAAQLLERGETVPVSTLSALQQFFSFFVLRSHRDKEEEVFFPALRDKGFPLHQGCIGVLMAEHEEDAAAFQEMVNEAEAFGAGDDSAGVRWANAERRYANAMRRHIRREEEVLFAGAATALADAEQQVLAKEFEACDQRARRAGLQEVIEEFERAARSLKK